MRYVPIVITRYVATLCESPWQLCAHVQLHGYISRVQTQWMALKFDKCLRDYKIYYDHNINEIPQGSLLIPSDVERVITLWTVVKLDLLVAESGW